MVKLKLKVLVVIPISLVIILLIGIVSAFYGIPFGNIIAKHYINQYSHVMYSDTGYTFGNISYNFKNSAYSTSMLDSNGSVITEMTYNWETNSLYDSSYNEEINKAFKANINSFLSKEYPLIQTTYVSVWETVDANQNFNATNLKKKDKIYVYMNDKATSTSTDESKLRFTEIVKKIFNSVESQYAAESSQIMYDNKHDIMEVLIGSEQSKLPDEELQKFIKVIHTYSTTEAPKVRADAVTVDSIDKFIAYVHQDLNAKYQVTQTTVEGDPIIQTLEYDGTTIKFTFDNTKDKFAGTSKGVITKEYLKIYKEGDLCYLLDKDGKKSIFPL
jgi:Domain of unknown function (DUF4362)